MAAKELTRDQNEARMLQNSLKAIVEVQAATQKKNPKEILLNGGKSSDPRIGKYQEQISRLTPKK